MGVYNNTGQAVALSVRQPHGPASDGKLVRVEPGWSKSYRFWDLMRDRDFRLVVGGCEYAYRLPERWPKDEQGETRYLVIVQLEPDYSLHLRTPGRGPLAPDQLKRLQEAGFPTSPTSKTCSAATPPA